MNPYVRVPVRRPAFTTIVSAIECLSLDLRPQRTFEVVDLSTTRIYWLILAGIEVTSVPFNVDLLFVLSCENMTSLPS